MFEYLSERRPKRTEPDYQTERLFAEARDAARLMNQSGEREREFVFGWARYLVSRLQIVDRAHVKVGLVLGGTVFVYRITEGQRKG